MKKEKVFANILFWLTLISPMASFILACMIGEVNIFEVAGIIRYSWIMYLFIPIGIISTLIGIKLKKENKKYKKNLIISFICLPFLIIFGSYRFIYNNVSYDVNKIFAIEKEINLELPNEIKIATIKSELYNLSYVKIIDNECKEAFEKKIESNQLWKNEVNVETKMLLPLDILYEIDIFDTFIFYNVTNDEYNIYPLKGEYNFIFIAYDYGAQRLIILDDYNININ